MQVALAPSQLHVISSALINIGSGLLLAVFTVNNPLILTESAILAILCFRLAFKIEAILEEYYDRFN